MLWPGAWPLRPGSPTGGGAAGGAADMLTIFISIAEQIDPS